MKNSKKIILYIGIFTVLFGVISAAVYNSPLGEKLLKNYIYSKLKFLNKFEIDEFNYKWNSFSLSLKKGSNYINIYGDIFPFDATYEADFKNLEEISKDVRGSLESKGIINYADYAVITGNALFAEGYGGLKLQCNDNCVGIFNGKEFDTEKLFYMIKLNFPYLSGQNDLNVVLKKGITNIYFNFVGSFNYKDKVFINKTYLTANVKFKNKKNFEIDLKNTSQPLFLEMNYKKNENNTTARATGVVDLKILRKILLYPVSGKEKLDFYYDSIGDILKFSSKNLKGFYSKNAINIQLNDLPIRKFFKYLNIDEFCGGVVNGNIVIKEKRGVFNIIASECVLKSGKITQYIKQITKKDIKNLKVVFLKGEFDDKKAVFNVLSKNKNLIISIQKGVYFYNGQFRYTIEIIVDNNYKYVFEANNKGVKLIKTLKSYKLQEEVLVY